MIGGENDRFEKEVGTQTDRDLIESRPQPTSKSLIGSACLLQHQWPFTCPVITEKKRGVRLIRFIRFQEFNY